MIKAAMNLGQSKVLQPKQSSVFDNIKGAKIEMCCPIMLSDCIKTYGEVGCAIGITFNP
jgi:hypothetical protein